MSIRGGRGRDGGSPVSGDPVERARARARARAAREQVAVLAPPPAPERSGRRARRIIWPVLISVVFVGLLFVAVFPTQVYLEQRAEADARREQLDERERGNAELEARVEALHDDEAIELLARKEWGLVKPGEEAYAVVGLEDGVGDAADAPDDQPERPVED